MSRLYVVLYEDLQSRVFIYRALKRLGVDRRDVRVRPYPDSRFNSSGGRSPRRVDGYKVYACGSQHVLMNFAAELKALRTEKARRDVALVVLFDADNETVDQRFQELDQVCIEEAVSKRETGDRVSWLVPRRNIETWIHFFLVGPPVDEHTAYRKFEKREAEAGPAAERFADLARANAVTPAQAPQSLMLGLSEFRRALSP